MECIGEDNRILDCLTCAHAQVRRHGVGRVAQENRAAINPAIDARPIEDVGAHNGIRRGHRQQALDGTVPAGEPGPEGLVKIRTIPSACGGACNGEPTDFLQADWQNAEPHAGAPGLSHPAPLPDINAGNESTPTCLAAVA